MKIDEFVNSVDLDEAVHYEQTLYALYIRLSKTGLIMSGAPFVRPSICPTVNFSCLLRNSDTVQDIFMKLGTNINHHQRICREQEP